MTGQNFQLVYVLPRSEIEKLLCRFLGDGEISSSQRQFASFNLLLLFYDPLII